MVANCDTGNAFADGFNLRIFAAASVLVGVADTSVKDLDAHFVRFGRRDFNLFDFERLACSPAYSSLALDGLSSGIRHGEM
jgi:hypothetical protein